MKTIYILNPAAGRGGAMSYKDEENAYVTKGGGDAFGFAAKTLEAADEDINFAVCGGDGTINEVVRGIIASGKKNACVSLIPTGTGNDLVRTVAQEGGDICADVLSVNDAVAVNAVNIGFDLDVVLRASQYKKKPFLSGSLAYIFGVVSTLFRRYGTHMRIEYVDSGGSRGVFEGECLLAVMGNGRYYGGGFEPSPAASMTDGLIDLTVVKKVSRLKFISLVGKYKKGLHIDIKNNRPYEQFRDILIFKKCKSVSVSGIENICCDGEIIGMKRAEIGVIPRAVRLLAGKETLRA